MSLSSEDYQLLRERRKQSSRWPLIGGGSLFFLLVLYAWASLAYPEMANPAHVYNALVNNQLELGTIRMLTLMAPVLFTLMFILIGVVLSLGFAIMRREKRLLDIIEKLISGKSE